MTKILPLLHHTLQLLTRSIDMEKKTIRDFIFENARNKNINILDFGCGEGIFSDIFENNIKVKYVGADENIKSLFFAKNFYKVNSFVATKENLSFKNNIFDFVILSNVLHHLNEEIVDCLLNEIKRVLKKDSFLVIIELVEPNKQKGFFFRFVTYLEKKIKRIRYRDRIFFESFTTKGFKMYSYESINSNFIKYIFSV